jgi:5-methylcytosine-specific restriction endonuclease McrA
MDYSSIYTKIIDRAKIRNLQKSKNFFIEKHHIIPKSCGGSNNKDNLVNLTLKEHYICHLLLERIYRKTPYHIKMLRAAFLMGRNGTKSSRTYQSIKENHIKNLKSQKISDEQKRSISIANKGNTARKGMKNSEEHALALKNSRIGSKHSEETKLDWSNKRKGNIPWNKEISGYKIPSYPKNRKSRGPISAETLEKMRLARINWHKNKGHKINERPNKSDENSIQY